MRRFTVMVLMSMVVLVGSGFPTALASWGMGIDDIVALADQQMATVADRAVDRIEHAETLSEVLGFEYDAGVDITGIAAKAREDLEDIAQDDPAQQASVDAAIKLIDTMRIAYLREVGDAVTAWQPPVPPSTTTTTLPVTTTTLPVTTTTIVALPPPTTTTTIPVSSTPTTTTLPPSTTTTTQPPSSSTPTTSSTTSTTTTTQPPATTTTQPPETTTTTTTVAPAASPVPPAGPPAGVTNLLAAPELPPDTVAVAAPEIARDPITELIGRSLSVVLPPALVFAALSPFAVLESVLRALMASGRELVIPVMLLSGALGWITGGATRLSALFRRLLGITGPKPI